MAHRPPIQIARKKNSVNTKPKKLVNLSYHVFQCIFISVQSVYDPFYQMAGEMVKVQSELSHLKHQKNQLEEKLKMLNSSVELREKDLRENVLKLQEEKVESRKQFKA